MVKRMRRMTRLKSISRPISRSKTYKLSNEQDRFWKEKFSRYTGKYGFGKMGLKKADELAYKDLTKKYPAIKKYKKIK